MSRITSRLLAVLLALGIAQAQAQTSTGGFPVGVTGSGTPGGSSGQLQYNSAGAFGGLTLGGDATLNTSTGALTVTKTNGAPFAPSATTDTTNAANISIGTLPAARLPNPSATTLGGVESLAPTAHQWLTGISTLGVPSAAQPSCADLSNAAASCATDATNAANISAGTLPAARLPAPTATALGGVESIAPTSHEWIDSISTLGAPHLSQPSASDVSGLGTAATVNTGTSGSLIPLLSTANTWTLAQTFQAAPILSSITGSTQCLHVNSSGVISGTGTDCGSASGGSGTVASVGLSLPSIFTVTGSPVTTSGTLTATLAPQSANTFLAGPTSGVAATPTVRAIVGADLPTPSATTLGGVESFAAVAHEWVNSISTAGVPSASQPACGDLSNAAASCSTDATNASNISAGILPAARLPTPSATTLGGVESAAAVSHQWINSISTAGVPALSQPSFGDISGSLPLGSQVSGVLGTANGGTGASSLVGANIPLQTGTITTGDCTKWASGTGITDAGAPCGSGTVTGGSNEGAGVGVYDSTNSTSTTLKFKTLVAGSNITLTDNGTSGISIAASGGGGGSTTIVQPQGRLTLTSGQPVMQSDVTGASTIYYTAQLGDQYPWYNGSAWTMQAFSSDLSMALDATNTTSGSLYDIFGYVNSGTPVACYGPAWTNSTTRSAAIARLNGVWVNSASITCRASSSTTYTVPADEGTYLGTFYATAAGQTGVSCKPAAASGGANNVIGLWNAYNRVPVSCIDAQSTGAYTNATQTWGPAGGTYTGFRISFVDGLGQSPADCEYSSSVSTTSASRFPLVGCDQNSTTTTPSAPGNAFSANGSGGYLAARENFAPVMGFDYYQAMQGGINVTGSTVTWNGAGTGSNESLVVRTTW